MRARAVRFFGVSLSIVLFLLVSPRLAQSGLIKLKVTIDNSAIYLGPSIGTQKVANVPVNTILDSEGKQGEFYKITLPQNGAKITGYIHEEVVEEISESEAERLGGEASAAEGTVRSQLEIATRLDSKIEENKELIRHGDLPRAVENLRSLIPAVFGLEDYKKQRQLACNIYYWLGVALTKSDDFSDATREFQNMWEVDAFYASEATKDVFDQNVSRLVETAKKIQKGLLVNYSLSINTEPQGATILIDGKISGKSPQIYPTTTPTFILEVEKEGFARVKKPMFLTEENSTVSLPLQSVGRTIRVSSKPPGAKVFLDDQDTGKITECDLPFVSYGSHKLRFTMENYADGEESFQLIEGPGSFAASAVLTIKDYSPHIKVGGSESKPFKLPQAIAVDGSGNIYIADESDYKIRKYNPELISLSWNDPGLTIRKLDTPAGIAFDRLGFMYVTDSANSCVVKFDRNGRQAGKWGRQGVRATELNGPTGITVDKNSDVYVADTGNSRIVKYSSTMVVKKLWGGRGTSQGDFFYPCGVAVNSNNDILVIDKGGRVQEFTAEGVYISEFGKQGSADGELSRPSGLCLDAEGYIYVADTGNHRIQKFSPDGKFIANLGGSGTPGGPLAGPVSVAVSDKGAVFVAEKDAHRIQEFRTAGK
jgi:DNA-binding beta-propeller fold protein YncE